MRKVFPLQKNVDGVSVFKFYARVFATLFREISVSKNEKQSLLKAFKPLALLKPQTIIQIDQQTYRAFVDQLKPFYQQPQKLFRTLLPDKFTDF